MKKILLTSARSYITLDLARFLSAAGHEVYVAETYKWHICHWSNAVKKSYLVPSPRKNADAFLNALVEITKTHEIDLLIPTCEEILYLSQGLDRFPAHCRVFAEPFDVLHPLHSKWLFQQEVTKAGLPAPATYVVETQEQLKALQSTGRYIIKPCYSRASQFLYRVEEGRPLPQLKLDPHNPWVAQQWLDGAKFCTYSIVHQGRITAHSVYPVGFSIQGNSCLVFESVEHPRIFHWIQTFVKAQNFTGQIGFDFIQTPQGDLYAIECNPRATSGVHLFRYEPNFIQAFLNPQQPVIKPKASIRQQIAMGMMIYGWKTAHPLKDLPRFLATLLTTRDVVFDWKDLGPFFSIPAVFPGYLLKGIQRGLSLPSAFTHEIDWNGDVPRLPTASKDRHTRSESPRNSSTEDEEEVESPPLCGCGKN